MNHADVVVIGAGASGLAAGATLGALGREPVLLERDARVGGTWDRRYERLCLHTVRQFSGLPHLPMPGSFPRYVPKGMYAQYLRDYAPRMELDVRTGQEVERIQRAAGPNDGWLVRTKTDEWQADALVIATGQYHTPRLPKWPGAESFRGRLLHASEYRTGRAFAGKRVLVVGIGNTGAEIAADLVEQGAASVAIAVRSSPPVTKREIFGIPVQFFGMALMPFPPGPVDRAGAVLRRIGTGDLGRYRIGPAAWGPFTARRPPVIDVGFLEQLEAGTVTVRPEVTGFTPDGVAFADGNREPFDVVIAATGYTTGLERVLNEPVVLDERGRPRPGAGSRIGFFSIGFAESPRGQLFETSRAAPKIAAAIDRYLNRTTGARS